MSKVKLFIDCQLFQTPAWDRGMGRYTLSLLKSLYAKSSNLNLVLILSQNLPKNPEVINVLAKTLPSIPIVYLDLRTTSTDHYNKNSQHNKKILNNFTRQHRTKNIKEAFLIAGLFQEPTCSVFPDSVEKMILYYDSIPLLYYQRYKVAINYNNYLDRHSVLFESDTIFTISKTIADDLSVYLGMKSDEHRRIINIDGACIDGMFDSFESLSKSTPKHYILFSTSNDIRKNNQAAVRAFEELRGATGTDYKLVITSDFSPEQLSDLASLSNNLIFTGNISNHQLAGLYKNAEVVLFTSEYEGLGLPILEAVKMNKKVACSNIPVFREISNEAFYYFDPLDVEDIALRLYQAIRGDNWEQKIKLYKQIRSRYTWQHSAKIMHDSIIATSAKNAPRHIVKPKPKVAILAPNPEGYSAIGKVVQEMHSMASQYFDISYYFEESKVKIPASVRPNYLKSLAPCYDVDDFNALVYREYDSVIYHIGNSDHHFLTLMNALHLPGIAIFHDTMLREAFGEMVRLGYMLPSRMEAEARLDKMIGSTRTHLLTSVINNQIGAIVHSEYAKSALSPLIIEGTQLKKINLPVSFPYQNTRSSSEDVIHVGLAGILSGRKGLEIIKELSLDVGLEKTAILHVFGFDFVDPQAVEELKNYENVRLTTNLSDLEYQTQLANLDILINYRLDYRGETSLTALEAMRYGCVVIVNGTLGWFSELPDRSVVKVSAPSEIIGKVRQLMKSDKERKQIGERAKEYVRINHDSKTYIKTLDQMIRSPKQSPNMLRAEAIKSSRSVNQAVKRYRLIQDAFKVGE